MLSIRQAAVRISRKLARPCPKAWIAVLLVSLLTAKAARAQQAVILGQPEDPAEEAHAAQSNSMSAFVVAEGLDKVYLTPNEIRLLSLYFGPDGMPGLEGLTPQMGQLYVVTPLRSLQRAKDEVASFRIIDGDALHLPPSPTFDGNLDSALEYTLTGRGSDLSTYPFDQGLLLRGIEARVLLDGIPVNDPFGGWVDWAAMPREGVFRVEIVPSAGAASWGDGSLGGIAQFFTEPANGRLVTVPGSLVDGGPPDPTVAKQVVVGTAQVAALVGDYGTQSIEVVASQPTSAGVLQLLGREFSTDGTALVGGGQRGPVDTAAWRWNDWLEARWRQLVGKSMVLTATLSDYRGSESDGTPDQSGFQKGETASIALADRVTGDFGWNAIIYARQVGSSGVFSFVNAARTTETPAIDLLSEPATAAGASWTGSWKNADGSNTVAGIDVHYDKGSMHEAMAFTGRALGAGGEQDDTGIYILRDQRIGPSVRLTVGGRITYWDESDGQVRLGNLASRTLLSDEELPSENGTEFSPEAGLVWRPSESLGIHLNGQQAFSRPTLSELYETVGQYSTVTEGNPDLRTEFNTSFELGAEYSFITEEERKKHATGFASLRPPEAFLVLGATALTNRMRDAIGDLDTSGNARLIPVSRPLPSGYLSQQAMNIDRSRIQGVELSARWSPNALVTVDARWQFSDPTITRDDTVPSLDGHQIGEVSRQTGLLSVEWHVSRTVELTSRIRVFGAEFQDNENTLRLGESVVADVGATFQMNKHAELSFELENIGDARIQISRNTDGVFYDGAPRMASTELRLKW